MVCRREQHRTGITHLTINHQLSTESWKHSSNWSPATFTPNRKRPLAHCHRFPNKRASLFFNEYLAAETDRPLWSPAYVSISELFRQLSPLKSGDPIRLVCELYKVFREETRSEETLDDFYFWGELLISDFDDVDKPCRC